MVKSIEISQRWVRNAEQQREKILQEFNKIYIK